MSLRLQTITGPYNGLEAKLRFIKGCYPKATMDPDFHTFVENSAGRGTRLEQATSLFNAIRQGLNYLPDPIGFEQTKSPSRIVKEILSFGSSSGDCDDHACFSFSALKTMGLPAKLRVVWLNGLDMPGHIYALAFLEDRWVPFDTTRQAGINTEAPYTHKEDF